MRLNKDAYERAVNIARNHNLLAPFLHITLSLRIMTTTLA